MPARAPLRLLYVAGSFPPAKSYGGPTESSSRLCEQLGALGVEVRVLAINADGPKRLPVEANRWTTWEGARVFYADRIGSTLIAPRAYLGLDGAWREIDVVHLAVGFSPLVPAITAQAALHRVPMVFSPRGTMLAEALAKSALRKRVFNATAGRICYPRFAAWHVTSDEERRAAAPFARGAPIAVVPNGVPVPAARAWPDPEIKPIARDAARPEYLVYLGRLDPHKQIERILSGFARGSDGTRVELWIAGEGDAAYVAALERVAAASPAAKRIRFVGYVGGAEKSALLAHAEGLVLASRSENFGLSVAEALAHATPCVVTRSAPWAGLETNGCGFWVETSPEGIAGGIRALLARAPDERRAMGARGRAWIERDFSWPKIGARMLDLYEAVRDRTSPSLA